MRPAKDEKRAPIKTARLQVEVDASILEHLQAMEQFTKIPQSELVMTAIKRFIATHKDYFPEGYKSS